MKNEKNKNTTVVIILIIILFLIVGIAAISAWYLSRPSDSQIVEIVQNNEVLYTLDLSEEEDRTFDIDYNGSINTVEIKDNKIRVKSADCPDKVCVDSGWLTSEGLPIVCLPNKLIIRFKGSSDVDSLSK